MVVTIESKATINGGKFYAPGPRSQGPRHDEVPLYILNVNIANVFNFSCIDFIALVQEKEHLHKFNLTWPLHNKHLFHSLIYMEPGLHDNLGTLIKQLRTVASQKEPYHEESYSSLLQRWELLFPVCLLFTGVNLGGGRKEA